MLSTRELLQQRKPSQLQIPVLWECWNWSCLSAIVPQKAFFGQFLSTAHATRFPSVTLLNLRNSGDRKPRMEPSIGRGMYAGQHDSPHSFPTFAFRKWVLPGSQLPLIQQQIWRCCVYSLTSKNGACIPNLPPPSYLNCESAFFNQRQRRGRTHLNTNTRGPMTKEWASFRFTRALHLSVC